MTTTNKEIASLLKSINKHYGEGKVSLMSEEDERLDIKRISSGSLNLDLAIGGGMPLGRTIEIYGKESSGKTTVAILHAIEMQKEFPDKYVAFIDVEHAADKNLFANYGLDLSRTTYVRPETGEEALDMMESLIRSGVISVIILDSISALLPEEEAQKTMKDQQMGLQARMLGKALRKITPAAAETGTEVIFINQVREKIGVMFGDPETTSGGRALQFFVSLRIKLWPSGTIKNPNDKDDVIGHQVKAKITKNKTFAPHKKASFDLIYGEGVDKVKEIADIAYQIEIVSRAGAYYQIKDPDGEKIIRKVGSEEVELSFQGKESLVDYLREDEDLYNILHRAVMTGQIPTVEELRGEETGE